MTIYAISRSIIAVVLNNSFIPLATRRTKKTTEASENVHDKTEETVTANTAAATVGMTAASGKQVALLQFASGLS